MENIEPNNASIQYIGPLTSPSQNQIDPNNQILTIEPPQGSELFGLRKTVYGVKGALEKLDEEFEEFALRKRSTKEFFDIYNKFFYKIEEQNHKNFIARSGNQAYPNGYINPRTLRIKDVKDQNNELQKKIDSLEKNIFFIPNRIIVMNTAHKNNPSGNFSNGIWYIHSATKRLIQDYQTYLNIKTRNLATEMKPDQDYIVFLSNSTLNKIPDGPVISKIEDLDKSYLEINIYPKTLEEYEGMDFNVNTQPGQGTPETE
tara:strand:- start:8941 stop:9717 length:777 start_codon:yes stop_codon:yes gene_type:complete